MKCPLCLSKMVVLEVRDTFIKTLEVAARIRRYACNTPSCRHRLSTLEIPRDCSITINFGIDRRHARLS